MGEVFDIHPFKLGPRTVLESVVTGTSSSKAFFSSHHVSSIKQLCILQDNLAAQHQEWFDMLSTFQWNGKPERLMEICQFVVQNGFSQLPQLQNADDPGTWEGADAFRNHELKIVRTIAQVGMHEPR